MGAGPLLLGHAHPRIVEAIRDAAGLINPMMPTTAGAALAERIRGHMTYLERLRFTNTGSEATRTAVRIARAVTGRRLVVKAEGNYHGADDVFLVSAHTGQPAGSAARPEPVVDYAGASPGVADEVVIIPFNDAEAAGRIIDERQADYRGGYRGAGRLLERRRHRGDPGVRAGAAGGDGAPRHRPDLRRGRLRLSHGPRRGAGVSRGDTRPGDDRQGDRRRAPARRASAAAPT